MVLQIDADSNTEIIRAQKEWLDKLQELEPSDQPILIKIAEGGIPKGADPDLYNWTNYKQVWAKVKTPIYTRGILLNEIMIDPDAEKWDDVRDEIRKLHSFCEKESIPHTMGFSGGKGIHFSIIFGGISAENSEATAEMYADVEKYNMDARKTVRRALLSVIARRADVDLDKLGLDKKKINFRTSSMGSQIREFGTTRAPGKYKTFITEIPDSKPEPGEFPLTFPEEVKIWTLKGTEFNDIAIDAIKQEIEKLKTSEEYTPISDYNFKDISITEFPCIARLFNAGVRTGRYYANVALVLMSRKCGLSKEDTERNLTALSKTFPNISQEEIDIRIHNALEMYDKDYRFSCTEIKETFPELNICDYQNCPIREKLTIEKKKLGDRNTRSILTDALVSIKPSPDKSIRIQQIKEFITTHLLNVDENLAEEFLITKIKKPFDFNSDEFGLLKRFFKSEQKKSKAFKLQRERENQEYAAISFGETADYSANAIAVLVDEFRNYHAPVFNLGGQLYIYNGRIYESDDAALAKMKSFLYQQAELHGINITPNNVNNVLKRIIDENTINAADLTTAPERIVVENGILDVLTGGLFDHDPTERHVTELNIRYDPTIQPSDDFRKYLDSTFNGEEWEIDLFQELFGYCLLREYRFEVFFFLVGNGGNGRTVATNLLNAFLGDMNVSSKKLQEICNPSDVFSLMGLHGKLANICGETGVEGIDDLSNLKAATGRDPIESRQPHKQWVRFNSYAKMIFSMNQVPAIKDSTRGRIRRMKIIDFRNSFVNGLNADEKLEEKLTTPESLTGVLNWAIEGLQRLIREGKFTDIRTESQIAIEFDRKSNPMKHFVLDHIDDARAEYELDPLKADIAFHSSRVTFAQIIQAYVKYAKVYNLPTLDPVKITSAVKYECELVGIMVKRCRDRYKKDPKTGKAAPREDFFRGIVLCGLDELELQKSETLNIDDVAEPKPETSNYEKVEAELPGHTKKYMVNTPQGNIVEA